MVSMLVLFLEIDSHLEICILDLTHRTCLLTCGKSSVLFFHVHVLFILFFKNSVA